MMIVNIKKKSSHRSQENNLEISPGGLKPSKSIKVVCDHVPEDLIDAGFTDFTTHQQKRRNYSLK